MGRICPECGKSLTVCLKSIDDGCVEMWEHVEERNNDPLDINERCRYSAPIDAKIVNGRLIRK